jgi:hypothetical protein
MRELQNLDLSFFDCAGIRSEADVAEVFQLVAGYSLVPNVRPWTRTPDPDPAPVQQIPTFLRLTHHKSPLAERKIQAGRRLGRLEPVENWGFAVLRRDMPEAAGLMSIGRSGEDNWDLGILAYGWTHRTTGQDPEEFITSWADLLLRIAEALYERVRPVLGEMSAESTGDYSRVEFPKYVERRKLLVGWRTWYGPAYVETFGKDFLLALPDRAAELPDGASCTSSRPRRRPWRGATRPSTPTCGPTYSNMGSSRPGPGRPARGDARPARHGAARLSASCRPMCSPRWGRPMN